jgi:Putative Actinobacterial Holin-X, holin superfamily III
MFGFVARTRSVKQRAQSLVRLNLELAKLEAKKKVAALGVAAGLALLAVVLVVYAIGFAFASAAAGISEALPLWLSLLIVAGLILLLAAIAGLLAARFAKKASPPMACVCSAWRWPPRRQAATFGAQSPAAS